MSEEKVDLERALERYGKVELKFDNYYKYAFEFRGKAADGTIVVLKVYGDVYRFEVDAVTPVYAIHLEPEAAWKSKGTVTFYSER